MSDDLVLVFDGRGSDLEAWRIDEFSEGSDDYLPVIADDVFFSNGGFFSAVHISGLRVTVSKIVQTEDGSLGSEEIAVSHIHGRTVDSAALNNIPLTSLLTKAAVETNLVEYQLSDVDGPPSRSDPDWRNRMTADVAYLRLVGASVAKSLAATHFEGDMKAARAWIRYLQRLGRI